MNLRFKPLLPLPSTAAFIVPTMLETSATAHGYLALLPCPSILYWVKDSFLYTKF